jgi:hypothetical protein
MSSGRGPSPCDTGTSGAAPSRLWASLTGVSSKIDRELAEIEARRAAAQAEGSVPKSGVGATLKRFAKDVLVRRHSTKR